MQKGLTLPLEIIDKIFSESQEDILNWRQPFLVDTQINYRIFGNYIVIYDRLHHVKILQPQ